jgi:hypothetical protein
MMGCDIYYGHDHTIDVDAGYNEGYCRACNRSEWHSQWREGCPARRIEAQSDETPQAAQPVGREPGPKDAPNPKGTDRDIR